MGDPLPCAFKVGRKKRACGGAPAVLANAWGHFAVCLNCEVQTPYVATEAKALASWNRLMRTENGEVNG